ncbi:MAG TPA: hypothetical protein VLN44_11640 [Pyrinomonadaceae bacterium]|nr:hypothetical protein [Pyrinomonadaceae bacterium]
MKFLSNQSEKEELLRRLLQVTPGSRRQWGKMTPHRMICHLNDSFKSVIGEQQVSVRKSSPVTPSLIRWIALYF